MNMAMFNGLKHNLGRLAGASTTKMGDIIIFTTVAGWIASSAAQIFGIATNKNYTSDQKKYMINQEIFDAATNIGLYFGITKSLKGLSSLMVRSAKLAPKSIVDFMRRNGISGNRGRIDFDITQARGFDEAGLKGTYDAFKCFADASAATIGGIISSNIITPIVRNGIASYRQNKNKPATTEPNAPQVIIPKPPVLNPVVTPRHTFDDYRTRVMSI